jgi:hypothetical protein
MNLYLSVHRLRSPPSTSSSSPTHSPQLTTRPTCPRGRATRRRAARTATTSGQCWIVIFARISIIFKIKGPAYYNTIIFRYFSSCETSRAPLLPLSRVPRPCFPLRCSCPSFIMAFSVPCRPLPALHLQLQTSLSPRTMTARFLFLLATHAPLLFPNVHSMLIVCHRGRVPSQPLPISLHMHLSPWSSRPIAT